MTGTKFPVVSSNSDPTAETSTWKKLLLVGAWICAAVGSATFTNKWCSNELPVIGSLSGIGSARAKYLECLILSVHVPLPTISPMSKASLVCKVSARSIYWYQVARQKLGNIHKLVGHVLALSRIVIRWIRRHINKERLDSKLLYSCFHRVKVRSRTCGGCLVRCFLWERGAAITNTHARVAAVSKEQHLQVDGFSVNAFHSSRKFFFQNRSYGSESRAKNSSFSVWFMGPPQIVNEMGYILVRRQF